MVEWKKAYTHLDRGGDRVHRVDVVQQSLTQLSHTQSHRPRRVALQPNHFIRAAQPVTTTIISGFPMKRSRYQDN